MPAARGNRSRAAASRRPISSPHDLALRAMPGVLSLDADGNARALDLLIARWTWIPAIRWRPRSRRGRMFSASSIISDGLEETRRAASNWRTKAEALGGDATVLAILGNALSPAPRLRCRRSGHPQGAGRSTAVGLGLEPQRMDRRLQGRSGSAIERFKIALDLAPHDPLAFNSMVGIGCAHVRRRPLCRRPHWQERALAEHPSAIWIHRTMCPAYVLAGPRPQARRSVGACGEHYPD